MNYNRLNNVVGWSVFGVAFLVYLYTMAQTASFWDCGEFIACANELQVPHPPGAPFYLILGRFFSLFSFGNVENVAYWVNMMSVLSGAFTVLFTFWIITHLAKKIVSPNAEPNKEQSWAILFSGIVGGLACTFSDSIWFNTVEAEVYAMSSFFTAAVVWLIFKWEARANEPHNLRFIVLIAFVMGISVGVHLLNLLTIPALAAIYYTKKNWETFNWGGFFLSLVAGVGILIFILYGMLQWGVELAWVFERVTTGTQTLQGEDVSGLGMPRGTGIIIYLLIIAAALVFGVFYSNKKKMPTLNAAVLSVIMITIGYSSYAMIVIRANAETPINENDPSSAITFLSYLKREQYGDRPLARGVRYNDIQNYKLKDGKRNYIQLKEPIPLEDGEHKTNDGTAFAVKGGKTTFKPTSGVNAEGVYEGKMDDGSSLYINVNTGEANYLQKRYVWDGRKKEMEYDGRYQVFFPRMYSGSHYDVAPYGYKEFVKRKGADPNSPYDDSPTMAEDIKFFWQYQNVHMYWRYFMWNFAGREGDIQDDGWESGVQFWKTSSMPDSMKDHPGKNHFFFLPLLLGLFGMVFQFSTRSKDALNILLLFFFTGLAIIIYLNQTPTQPRERDYSYAGSFQTFCIWIGLGVTAMYMVVKDVLKSASPWAVGALCTVLVPGIMGLQGWNDHTRRQRYVAPDSAYNLLNSCEKNAILFTNGDNDTFPLWYLQEVEGVRTDVRVVNLSLLNTDWYIDQMKKQSNESPPLPISIKQIDYIGEKNAYQPFPRGKQVSLKVDREKVLANGTVQPEDANRIVSPLTWEMKIRGGGQNTYILKQDWLILDMLINNANNGWDRPIYFSSTIPPSSYIGMVPFFQVEGLAYRVVPVAFTDPNKDPCNTDPYRQGALNKNLSYDKVMNVFRYRGLDNPNLYVDDHIRRTIIGNLRSTIFRTANAFVDEAACLENDIARYSNAIKQLESANPEGAAAQIDSLNKLIAAKRPVIEEDKKKAREVLEMSETRIPVSVVEADPIFLMFMGQAYRRLGDMEKATGYYTDIVTMVDETLGWYKDNDRQFGSFDRYYSTLGYIEREALEMKDYELAAKVNDAYFHIEKQPQFQQKAQQLRSQGGANGPAAPLQ